MSDQQVIADVKSGKEETLAHVYQKYRNEFIRWATRLFAWCDDDIAKDVYQVAIVIFYENILSGKLVSLNSSVKTYVFAIGKNKLMEHQHAAKKAQAIQEHFVREPLADDAADDREDTVRLVEKALAELGEPCKSLLELYYYKNYSIDQIAGALNYKSNDSAKTQKYKCLTRLKKIVYEQTSSYKS